MTTNEEKTIEEKYSEALGHHKAGKLQEAEAIYRQILERSPNHCDSLCSIGTIAYQVKNYAAAIEYITKAINILPSAAYYNFKPIKIINTQTFPGLAF